MNKNPKKYKYPRFPEMSLHLLSGMETLCDKNWNSDSKRISDEYNRLYCVLGGKAMIEGCRGQLILEPGYIYLIPGQYKFSHNCPVSMQLLWMHFQLEFLPGLDVFQQYEPEAFYAASKSDIAEFKNIISDIESSSPVVFIEQRALLLRLLKDFMPDDWKTIQPAPENAERLKPALELLNKKYNQPFDLRATAKTVNMNPAYMSDMFRRTFGAPPSRYLMNLRIRHAQNLLLTTDRRISDIAAECGFENPLYFSRIFTKRCRFSPRHFRQNRGI